MGQGETTTLKLLVCGKSILKIQLHNGSLRPTWTSYYLPLSLLSLSLPPPSLRPLSLPPSLFSPSLTFHLHIYMHLPSPLTLLHFLQFSRILPISYVHKGKGCI